MAARVSLDRVWTLTGGEGKLDAAAEQALARHGIAVSKPGGDTLELSGGSGIKMRLLGGWFVNPKTLPKLGSIRLRSLESGVVEIALHVEEAMGFGVLDRKLAGKYQETFEEVASDVEAALASVADSCERQEGENP
jgi:hypothetical protein